MHNRRKEDKVVIFCVIVVIAGMFLLSLISYQSGGRTIPFPFFFLN